jgi:hypothetical protein
MQTTYRRFAANALMMVPYTTNRPLRDPKAVLRNPYQLILTMGNNVRCSLKRAHARFLAKRCGSNIEKIARMSRRANTQSELGADRVLRMRSSNGH